MPLAGHGDVLGAVEPQADRAPGQGGAERRDGGQPVRLELLAAEAAAHPQALHGDLVGGQAEHVRHDVLRLRRVLRARLDEDLAALVDQRQRGLGLQVEVLLAADLELAAEPVRGPLQRGGRVAAADRPLVALVAAGLDRVVHGDQRGQRLVAGLDRFRALPGRLQGLAEHPADRVAVIHDLAGEQRLVVLLAGVVEAGHVVGGQHPHHAGHLVGGVGPQAGDAGVRVRGLDRPGVQGAQRAAGQVLGVERGAGHVLFRALVGDRQAHHGPVRAVGQRAHAPLMVGPPGALPSWVLGEELQQRVAQHRDPVGLAGAVVAHRRAGPGQFRRGRFDHLARPRPPGQRVLGGPRAQRRGRHPAQPDPDRGDPRPAGLASTAHPFQPERVGDGDARDVVEPALGDLVERGDRGHRPRDANRLDQLIGALDALPVAGEVPVQPDLALALARGQHERGVQREQHRRGVADRRGGAEVAAERGPVADQPGRELREQLVKQRHPAGPRSQPGLDLRQAQRGADVDAVGADRELAQLLDPLDADGQRGPGVPDVQLDAPVGGPGHQPRVRLGGQQAEGIGQAGRAHVASLRAAGLLPSRWPRRRARVRPAGRAAGRRRPAGPGRRPRP